MWSQTTRDLILAAVECNDSIESEQFNQSIANIQDWLGQNDGSFASLYFADYQEGGWEGLAPNERLVVIAGYIRNEINELRLDIEQRMNAADESLERPDATGPKPDSLNM